MDIGGLSWSLEALTDIPQLGRLWSELETRSGCDFFLTWDWIGTWLSMTPGLSPILLSVSDGPSVVALALFQPVTVRGRIGSVQAWMLHRSGESSEDRITIEYNGILSDRRYERRIEDGLFAFLAEAPAWQEIHLGLATGTIAEWAKRAGLIVTEASRYHSWFVDLATIRADSRQYLDTLSANTRYQIRRAIRMYQSLGPLNARAAESVKEAVEFFEELKVLHQRTWVQRGLADSFSSRHFEDFHRALLSRCVEQGSAEIVRVAAGKHLIGQVYNFLRDGRVYAYQTGLSYGSDPKLKPGLVCHTMCLERHLRGGRARIYDFMAGGGRYKASLGVRGPDMGYYIFQRKTLMSQSMALARRIKDAFRNSQNIEPDLS